MRIGSDEHKQLFCRSFLESYCAYDPQEWPWPQLDELSLARLCAIPIWTLALEVELGAGAMLEGFAKTEPDPLVRQALELQGYEEDRHGRILQCMIERYGLTVTPNVPEKKPIRGAFIDFGYDECVDSFAGFGIFRLARDARLLPEALTSLFARVLVEEARHIVFFVNWIAWDRSRRGLRGPILQAVPVIASYGAAIGRKVKGGAQLHLDKSQNIRPICSPMRSRASRRPCFCEHALGKTIGTWRRSIRACCGRASFRRLQKWAWGSSRRSSVCAPPFRNRRSARRASRTRPYTSFNYLSHFIDSPILSS